MEEGVTITGMPQEFGFSVSHSEEGEVRIPLHGYHLIALRQISYELLNSPALLDLLSKR